MATRTYDTSGERAQVILVWMRAPDIGNASYPHKTRSHEGKAISCINTDHVLLQLEYQPPLTNNIKT